MDLEDPGLGGTAQSKKPFIFISEKNGFDFPRYQKKHYRCALVFRGFCDKTLFLPKMAKTTAPPWPILFSAFLLAYAITRKFASRACPQGACPHAFEPDSASVSGKCSCVENKNRLSTLLKDTIITTHHFAAPPVTYALLPP